MRANQTKSIVTTAKPSWLLCPVAMTCCHPGVPSGFSGGCEYTPCGLTLRLRCGIFTAAARKLATARLACRDRILLCHEEPRAGRTPKRRALAVGPLPETESQLMACRRGGKFICGCMVSRFRWAATLRGSGPMRHLPAKLDYCAAVAVAP